MFRGGQAMYDWSKLLFAGVILVALILVLVGTGAMPILIRVGTSIANTVGAALWTLITKR
jgi:hypothetical protein